MLITHTNQQISRLQTLNNSDFVSYFNFQLACGTVINLATYKDHSSECKAKLSKVLDMLVFVI